MRASISFITCAGLLCLMFCITPVKAGDSCDRTLQTPGLNILVNPTKSNIPANSWNTVVWSVCATDVYIARPTENKQTPSPDTNKPIVFMQESDKILERIDTQALATQGPALVTVVRRKNFSPRITPWENRSDGFRFGISLGVIDSAKQGSAASYIDASFIISSKTTKRSFWLLISLFDQRTAENIENTNDVSKVFCSPSKGTKLPIISTPIGGATKILQTETGKKENSRFLAKDFVFTVNKTSLATMINKLNNYSSWCIDTNSFPVEPEDYEIDQASLMFESFIGRRPSDHPALDQWTRVSILSGPPNFEILRLRR